MNFVELLKFEGSYYTFENEGKFERHSNGYFLFHGNDIEQ